MFSFSNLASCRISPSGIYIEQYSKISMTSKITSTKIQDTLTRIAELRAVQRHFDVTLDLLESTIAKKEQLELKMVDELEDITKLESLGIKSIFHKILGNKEEQLEKERQEYLQVTLEHKEILNSLEVIEFEKSILERKLVELDDLVVDLEALKKTREDEILMTPSPLRNELKDTYQKVDLVVNFQKELEEAAKAGQAAYSSLDIVSGHMKKAKEWGNWDMMGGNNGRYHKSMKHGSIDRAMYEVSRSKLALQTFNKELSDIGYNNRRLALQLDNISKFPGMIFDNLISDWIVQNKIKSVLSTVSSLMDDLKLTLHSIVKDKDKALEQLEGLQKNLDDLLETK